MRRFLLAMLLAGTAISPALAERPGRDRDSDSQDRQVERSESHQDRSEARQERSEARQQARAERMQQVDRRADRSSLTARARSLDVGQSADGEARRAQVREQIRDRASDQGQADAAEIEARRAQIRQRMRDRSGDAGAAQANVNERGRPVLQQDSNDGDSVRNWRRDSRDTAQQRIDQVPLRDRLRVRVPDGARPDRPAPLPQTALNRQGDQHHWRTDWRHDRRYDWHNHRRHHRSLFHLGFYFDPFGWGYHRYGIGWRLWPSYYSDNYWLNDPYQYRLPYAPYPYRWIRYYDDALLVNTFTGQVVDVIYDFFW